MQQKLYKKLAQLWSIQKELRLKVFLLSLIFLFMSACLVIWRPLKYSIFSKMVGPTFVPNAKLLSLFVLIPLILLYSKLVDWLRRHHLLYWFTLFHGILGIFFYGILSHPVYGIANTSASPDRAAGWMFYFFMESFDAFFSTTFWSFADSINKPNDAKNYYGFIVSGSKIGGILSAGLFYLFLRTTTIHNQMTVIPNFILIGSLCLFAAAASIYCLVKYVPENIMHGYEKAYELEHEKESVSPTGFWSSLKGAFDGLFIMLKSSYVFGIFLLVMFYDIIIVIFDYIVMLQADKAHTTIAGMTSLYALYYFMMNFIGLGISLFGTTPILRILGVRLSLLIFPIICLFMLVFTSIFPSHWVLFSTLVGLRAFNYALNHPTREVLYIPTTKAIKFKAKTWTDAFGSRISKTFGSIFNKIMQNTDYSTALLSSIGLSISLSGLWIIIVYFLGKTLQDAITHNRVIGKEETTK